MKVNLILSSDEIEQLIIAHIKTSGFETANKELDVEFKFDGEDISAVVSVEDAAEVPKVKRTRRTREQMEADARGEHAPAHHALMPVTQAEVAEVIEAEPVVAETEPVEATYEEAAPFVFNSPATEEAPIDLGTEPVVAEEPPKTKGIFG